MTTRYVEAGPVLSASNITFFSVDLSWTDISIANFVRVTGYRLYRGLGANPTSWSLIRSQSGLTYTDSGLGENTTYSYYVVGTYENGMPTRPSNIVTIKTSYSLTYMYALRSGGFDIIDVHDPTSMFRVSTLGYSQGTNIAEQYADPDYLYWANIGKVNIFKTTPDPLNPTNPYSALWFHQMVVRRNLGTFNNKMFCWLGSTGGGTLGMYCLDISDPSNPSQIGFNNCSTDTFISSGIYLPAQSALAFDPSAGYLWLCYYLTGNGAFVYRFSVGSNGAIGNPEQKYTHLYAGMQGCNVGFIYGGAYWFIWNGVQLESYKLDGSGPLYSAMALPGAPFDFHYQAARVSGNYLYLGADGANAAHSPIIVIDLTTRTVVASIGPTNTNCNGFTLAGTHLFYTSGTSVYAYDISNPLAPNLIGTLNGLPAQLAGISGYSSKGWAGNNGGCET